MLDIKDIKNGTLLQYIEMNNSRNKIKKYVLVIKVHDDANLTGLFCLDCFWLDNKKISLWGLTDSNIDFYKIKKIC